MNDNLNFYGYHSSRNEFKDGYYKGDVDSQYREAVIETYQNYVSDYDDNLENDDIEQMVDILNDMGFSFTFVSTSPIMASQFQAGKYKYGDYLYKVYGNGNEFVLDDYNEINAEIIVSREPLYFEQIENIDEAKLFIKMMIREHLIPKNNSKIK